MQALHINVQQQPFHCEPSRTLAHQHRQQARQKYLFLQAGESMGHVYRRRLCCLSFAAWGGPSPSAAQSDCPCVPLQPMAHIEKASYCCQSQPNGRTSVYRCLCCIALQSMLQQCMQLSVQADLASSCGIVKVVTVMFLCKDNLDVRTTPVVTNGCILTAVVPLSKDDLM